MPRRCCAAGCSNLAKASKDWNEVVVLFKFPQKEPELSIWQRAVQLRRSDRKLSKDSLICSKHFNDEDFENKDRYINMASFGMKPEQLRLKKGAVPHSSKVDSSTLPAEFGPRAESARKKTVRQLLNTYASASKDEDSDISEYESDSDVSDNVDDDPDYQDDEADKSVCYQDHCDFSERYNVGVPLKEKKVLVEMSQLLPLLRRCEKCGSQDDLVNISSYDSGAFFKATLSCQVCNQTWTWSNGADSQMMNVLLCGSILFTGHSPSKIKEYMELNRILFPSTSTFFHYQRVSEAHGGLLHRVVKDEWMQQRVANIAESKDVADVESDCRTTRGSSKRSKGQCGVKLAGDGRNDSMGYCAQYGTYSLMDVDTRKILDINTISRVETAMNSYQTELEGLKRCLDSLKKELPIHALTTDRHAQIRKHMAKNEESIKQFYDSWHLVKAIHKNLTKISKRKGCEELTSDRIDSICNRLYRMAQTTPPDDNYATIMDEKRKAILNHIVGVHEHPENMYYKKCSHGEVNTLTLDKYGEAYAEVKSYLNKPEIRAAISKMTPYGQTSRLESFHNVILKFAPKHQWFGFYGMESRMYLAALHYNENSTRPLLTDDDGHVMLRGAYVKWQKGKVKVSKRFTPTTKEYQSNLMKKLWTSMVTRDWASLPSLPDCPPTQTSQLSREDKEQAFANFHRRSRFSTM